MEIDIRFNDLAEVADMEDDLDILDSDLEYLLSVRERITSSVSAHRKEIYRKEFINGSAVQAVSDTEDENSDPSQPKRPIGYSRAETSRSAKKNKSRRGEIRRTGMSMKDPDTQISIPYVAKNSTVDMNFDDGFSESDMADLEGVSDSDMQFYLKYPHPESPDFIKAYLNNPRVRDKKPENTETYRRKREPFETPVHLRMGEYVPESHARMVKKIAQSRAVLTSFINGTNWDLTRRLRELRGQLGNPQFAGQKGKIELEIAKLEDVCRLAYDAMKRTKSRVMKMKREQKLGVNQKKRRRYQIRQHEASFFSQAAANLKN